MTPKEHRVDAHTQKKYSRENTSTDLKIYPITLTRYRLQDQFSVQDSADSSCEVADCHQIKRLLCDRHTGELWWPVRKC